MSTSVEARRAIEAILMVADQPIEPNLLAQVCEISAAAVEEICAELAASYEAENRGFVLARVAGGYRFQSHPDLAPYIERFVLDGQSARLSAAALETLAIVAYKQPISRAQVASIRGVSVDGVMKTLQARGYITEVGRDPGPGNAVLFGTTPVFLERLGLNSVDDLPALGAFVPGADVVEQLERTLRVTGDPDAAPPAAEVTAEADAGDPAPAGEQSATPAVEQPAAEQSAVREAAPVTPTAPAATARPDAPPTPPPPPGGALREVAAAGFPGGGAEGFAGGETGGFAGAGHRPTPTSDPAASPNPNPSPNPSSSSLAPPGPVPPLPGAAAPRPAPGDPAHRDPEPPRGSEPLPGPSSVPSRPWSTPAPSSVSSPAPAGGSAPGGPSAAVTTEPTEPTGPESGPA